VKLLLPVIALLMLSGCASSGLYHWGDYEQASYSYTKNPGEIDAYMESLEKIIRKGEKNNRVPPGLYAEYGYALVVAGRRGEAVDYFAKEQGKWPESDRLMSLMINGVPITPPVPDESGPRPDQGVVGGADPYAQDEYIDVEDTASAAPSTEPAARELEPMEIGVEEE
jgi:hypothetical protein